MMDQAFFSTDVLAYSIIGLCAFMILFGIYRIIRVYSAMKVEDHSFIDVHAIYDVFKKDMKRQDDGPSINTDKLMLQELYSLKIPTDQRYIN